MSPESNIAVPDTELWTPSRREFLIAGAAATFGIHASRTQISQAMDPATEKKHGPHPSIEEEWKKSRPFFENVAEVGGWEKWYQSLSENEQAKLFFTADELEKNPYKQATCSDEGIIPGVEGSNVGADRLLYQRPGSGMLGALDRDDKNAFAEDFIESVAREMIVNNVDIVTNHIACGAAAIVYSARIVYLRSKNRHDEADALANLKGGADEYAKRWAQGVVSCMKKLSKDNPEYADRMKYDFVGKLARNTGGHPGQMLLVDTTLEYRRKNEVMPTFTYVESAVPNNPGKTLKEGAALEGIAMGDHGVGAMLTTKFAEQFHLVCIGRSQPELDKALAQAYAVHAEFSKDARRKIAISGILRDMEA